jgi:hypothetical protein
MNIFRACK